MSETSAACCVCGTCPTCTGTLPRPPVADPMTFAHGAIKHRMLARIGSTEVDGKRSLGALSTRDDDDPAIALIDAVAGSLHILAWNAARLYDDGTITRTEDRDALVDLARLLGYEPRPALAATTTLAFTLDDFNASPKVATIPKGTKVASVPAQNNDKSQTFETDAELTARAEWNGLKPVPKRRFQQITKTTTLIILDGATTTAKTGDLVLIYLKPSTTHTNWLCARIGKVTREPNLQPLQTRIDLTSPLLLTVDKALEDDALINSVIILGQRAAAFGAGAPDLALMTDAVRTAQGAGSTDWKDLVMTGDLDAVYADAVPGRVVFFTAGTSEAADNQIGRIKSVTEHSRAQFGLSGKISQIDVTGVDVADSKNFFHDKVRATAIHIETARETLLVTEDDVPLPADPPDRITVTGSVALPIGRRIVLTGKQWAGSSDIGEVATLYACTPSDDNTELVFERNIASRFHSTSLLVLANCVGASHGETPSGGAELIGSGNASAASPRFQLKGAPLTYRPAANPRGYAPAIEVRVGDRLYREQPTIFGLDSADRAYAVKQVRDGKSEVQFAGRLPTGTHNVSALYRFGGGTAGNLAPGRISTVVAPIMGVRAVRNPVPADGASDAETLEDMRSAAPQSIGTLDRVVSLTDFEAFARAFRGIGKAIATELDVGMRSVVCLTIATSDLTSPTPGSDVIEALCTALSLVAAPGRSVRIEGFTDLTASVTVALAIDPALRRADVEAAVRTALGKKFGRAARNFGEALHRSAVLAAVQQVEGVLAATLTVFALPGGPPESEGRLLCPAPLMSSGVFRQAGLLSLNPGQIQFAEMQP